MTEDVSRSADGPQVSTSGDRLDSWKEIAAYLKRDVTTVRRWEKREGLPIHRHLHERRDSVYAYTAEIDEWWQGRRNHLSANGADNSMAAGNGDQSVPAGGDVADHAGHRRRLQIAWAVAAICFAAALALTATLAVFYMRPGSRGHDEVRFPLLPPEGTSLGVVSLSPDGRRLAFTASTSAGKTLLWVRPLDALEAQPLPETDGARFPFWSPNSDAIGFFADGKLWTVAVNGGSPRVLCDAAEGHGGTWNRNDVIVFAPGRMGPLYRVPASGGSPTPVTTVAGTGERGHIWPEFLPDGNHFLYLADSAEPEPHTLVVGALDGSERKPLFTRAMSNAMYTRDGYLLFARARQLLAQPFDVRRLTLTGEPVVVADEVLQPWDLLHKTDFSVSDAGSLVFRSIRSAHAQLVWRDRAERQIALVNESANYNEPTLSPDQARFAVDLFDLRPSKRFGFGVAGVTSDIWILDSTKGTGRQLTSHPGAEFDPLWSPDGRTIVFSSNRGGVLDLYQKPVDGTGDEELLFASNLNKHAHAWSPDGRFLVFVTYEPKTKQDLWLLPMVGDRTPTPLLRDEFSQEQVQISPDGRWFAYASDESGKWEVHVQSFPTPGAKWQISTNGGGDPRWRPDGKELFYIADDRRLMAVPVQIGATFSHGAATALFDTGMQPSWGAGRNHYDVSRDGQRFLFLVPAADDRSSPFTIVLNWAAALRN